jgi:transposase
MVWAGGEEMAPSSLENPRWSTPMPQPDDLSRSLTALDQDSTLIAIIEMSQASWLVGAIVPGIERHPLKKLAPDAEELLQLLRRWGREAAKAGRAVKRIAVAFEAGRDGFWLARWLSAHGVEAHVIHASSVAVSREHRRAKTDRLDVDLLKRAFLGWLRGERDHCKMAAIPTLELEDARRPSRERETLVGERTRIINRMKSTLARLGIRNFRPNLRGPAPAKAGGARALGGAAHARGSNPPGQYQGRAATRHGASATGERTDQRDRADAPEARRPAAGGRTPCDAGSAGARYRRRHRDR